MKREERDEYLRKYGHLPISGGDGTEDDEEEDDQENDDEDAEHDDDEDDSQNRQSRKSSAGFRSQADFDRALKNRLRREVRKLTPTIRAEVAAELKKKSGTDDATLQAKLDEAMNKLANLDTLEEMVLTYDELAEERFEQMLSTLPEALQLMAPDDDAPALEKERWLTKKALPALSKFKPKGDEESEEDEEDGAKKKEKVKTGTRRTTSRPGFNPAKPGDERGDRKKIDELVKSYQQSGQYRRM